MTDDKSLRDKLDHYRKLLRLVIDPQAENSLRVQIEMMESQLAPVPATTRPPE